jgi:hypothetical protein
VFATEIEHACGLAVKALVARKHSAVMVKTPTAAANADRCRSATTSFRRVTPRSTDYSDVAVASNPAPR